MSTQATKLVIITEMLLFKHIVRILEAAGATGYTVTAAEGKGSRNTRSPGHPSVSDTFESRQLLRQFLRDHLHHPG